MYSTSALILKVSTRLAYAFIREHRARVLQNLCIEYVGGHYS